MKLNGGTLGDRRGEIISTPLSHHHSTCATLEGLMEEEEEEEQENEDEVMSAVAEE